MHFSYLDSRRGYFVSAASHFYAVRNETRIQTERMRAHDNELRLERKFIKLFCIHCSTRSGTVERRALLKNVIYRIEFALIARASLMLCRCTQFRRLIYIRIFFLTPFGTFAKFFETKIVLNVNCVRWRGAAMRQVFPAHSKVQSEQHVVFVSRKE